MRDPIKLMMDEIEEQSNRIVELESANEQLRGVANTVCLQYQTDTLRDLAYVTKLREALEKCTEALRYNLAVYSRKDEPMMLSAYDLASKLLNGNGE